MPYRPQPRPLRSWLACQLCAMWRVFALLILLLVCHPAWAQSLTAIPPLSARVTDLSNSLSQDQQLALDRKLAAFEQDWGGQIVVLLLPSTQPEDIAAYANRAFNQWKPGRAGIGDGVLLVVAVQDRRMRIEVGRTLEGAVPDLAAKRIIDEQMAPAFRRGDFYTGLDLATDQLMQRLRGETPPPATLATPATPAVEDWRWLDLGILLLIVFPMVGSLTRRILGHKPGSLASGLIVATLIHAVTSSLLLAGLGGVLALLLTYLAGTALGQAIIATQRPHNTHGGWGDGGWSGGGGMGGGGSVGGSGGGFSSGGGGDGAGGGASGSW